MLEIFKETKNPVPMIVGCRYAVWCGDDRHEGTFHGIVFNARTKKEGGFYVGLEIFSEELSEESYRVTIKMLWSPNITQVYALDDWSEQEVEDGQGDL